MHPNKASLKFLPILNAEGKREDMLFRVDASRNEYIQIGNYWIRNFAKANVVSKDINDLYNDEEIKVLIDNEIKNAKLNAPNILDENFSFENVLIIGDGFGFDEHKDLLNNIREDFCVIAINNTMRFWQAIKLPDFFLVTNPFENIFSQTPEKAFPKLIASRRANNKFVSFYRNIKYFYDPACDSKYQSPISKDAVQFIDEYRNPVCAALGCAYYFNAKNIFLAYCSDAYKEMRPGCDKISDGIFCYPQQILANKIINANIFWNKLSNTNNMIYYTGIKNSFTFAKYLQNGDFNKMIS